MNQDSFGTDLRVWTFDGMRASETLMPAGLHLAEHAHDAGQICFVLEGSYIEWIGDRSRVLTPGTMHVRAPNETHANEFTSAVLTLLISIDPARWMMPRMLDEVARAVACTVERSEPAWLRDAVSLIERRSMEPLTLSTIASAIGVRRGALAAAFRRFRGRSVGESIRAVRVAKAKDLLGTKMPLAEIAWRCGFHDQAHFTRVFRAATGETPGRWRSKNAGAGFRPPAAPK